MEDKRSCILMSNIGELRWTANTTHDAIERRDAPSTRFQLNDGEIRTFGNEPTLANQTPDVLCQPASRRLQHNKVTEIEHHKSALEL